MNNQLSIMQDITMLLNEEDFQGKKVKDLLDDIPDSAFSHHVVSMTN